MKMGKRLHDLCAGRGNLGHSLNDLAFSEKMGET